MESPSTIYGSCLSKFSLNHCVEYFCFMGRTSEKVSILCRFKLIFSYNVFIYTYMIFCDKVSRFFSLPITEKRQFYRAISQNFAPFIFPRGWWLWLSCYNWNLLTSQERTMIITPWDLNTIPFKAGIIGGIRFKTLYLREATAPFLRILSVSAIRSLWCHDGYDHGDTWIDEFAPPSCFTNFKIR